MEDAAYPEPSDGPPGSLFCLAPDWVYHAPLVASEAVGSYPTFSPLLRRNGAVCFLWHCPSGRLEPSLPPFQEESCPVVSGLSSPATGPERISASWKITKGRLDHATTQKLYKLETCDHDKSGAIRKGRKGGLRRRLGTGGPCPCLGSLFPVLPLRY